MTLVLSPRQMATLNNLLFPQGIIALTLFYVAITKYME